MNALLRDLSSPNEYVRGSVLRCLCAPTLQRAELLVPLVDSVRQNLSHPHPYVRRHAVLALAQLHRAHPNLLPDAPSLLRDLLDSDEKDSAVRRHALLALFECAREEALAVLHNLLMEDSGSLVHLGELLQLVVVGLIRRSVHDPSAPRGRYLRAVHTLLGSNAPAVQFAAAHTLSLLSRAPTAISAAAQAYATLLAGASDNNVKLVVLDRLRSLHQAHTRVMQRLVLDIARALQSPSSTIRNATLSLVLDLVAPSTVRSVVSLFKKELIRASSERFEEGGAYRTALVRALHTCAMRFSDVAGDVVVALLDFVGDDEDGSNTALEVLACVREVLANAPALRANVHARLLNSLEQVKGSRPLCAALWLVGEYAEGGKEAEQSLSTLLSLAKQNPQQVDLAVSNASNNGSSSSKSAPKVLADGTYASHSALEETQGAPAVLVDDTNAISRALTLGDGYVAVSLAVALTKLILRLRAAVQPAALIRPHARALLQLTQLLRLCVRDRDSCERVAVCVKLLRSLNEPTTAQRAFSQLSKGAFDTYLSLSHAKLKARLAQEQKQLPAAAVDALPTISQLLRAKNLVGEAGDEAEVDQARGAEEEHRLDLSRVVQLTGFSDPVYAEAHVRVHQYDVTLTITVINQTADTLQGLALELATLGDLQLVERPSALALGPYAQRNLVAHLKVSSTENGAIFGSLVYEAGGKEIVVVLNEIHVDIIDYIAPADTDEASFRRMWQAFEWENKLTVQTTRTCVIT